MCEKSCIILLALIGNAVDANSVITLRQEHLLLQAIGTTSVFTRQFASSPV